MVNIRAQPQGALVGLQFELEQVFRVLVERYIGFVWRWPIEREDGSELLYKHLITS